jgi:hypothetical protein
MIAAHIDKMLREKAELIVFKFPFNQGDVNISNAQWEAMIASIHHELVLAWSRSFGSMTY